VNGGGWRHGWQAAVKIIYFDHGPKPVAAHPAQHFGFYSHRAAIAILI
jgi:hypothetical protein